MYGQQLNSRQLDSLYYNVVKIRMPGHLRNKFQKSPASTSHIKSAAGYFSAVRLSLRLFNEQQRGVLLKILSRPSADTSFVSPEGRFRIHYFLSGINAPTYNLQLFAEACDSVYNFEVKYVGYPPPLPDDSAGGDNRYDVYIMNIGNVYGYTVPDSEIIPGSHRYTAFTVVNNDFTGFYTTGINAARVTIAHEFAHAIHFGIFDRTLEDEFFYELSATAMEHFVFGTIKDYLQYLPDYFNNTQNSFGLNGTIQEFALGIWNIYQKDRFGFGIIKREWELMPQMRAMDAINTAIQEYGSSFATELNTFGIWMYYTNFRTIPGKYFEDAAYYPVVTPVTTLKFDTGLSTVLGTGPSSNCFVTIANSSNTDTLEFIITNSDVQDAIDSTENFYSINFRILNHYVEGAENIRNYYVVFNAKNGAFWTTAEVLNNRIVIPGQNLAGQINFSFPSPFNYGKDPFIYVPVNQVDNSDVQFNVYSITMNLVFSSYETISYYNGEKVVKWNAKNSNNNKLPTGVYIYVVKSGDMVGKGKLVIINQ